MAGVGRISLLIDSPLRTVNLAYRGMEPEMRKQITSRLKPVATSAWQEETRGHALTRLQSRVLAGTARAGVSGLSVSLNSGGGGKLSSGTPTGLLSRAVAFGAGPGKLQTVRSRKGKTFKRRMGNRFPRATAQGGWVVYPSARVAIPRVSGLVVQTAIRTAHEVAEKAGN